MLSIDEFVKKTSDAYSCNRYNSWAACIRALRKLDLDDLEIEAILRSKWTRWAADHSKNPYGKASSNDLIRYIKTYETKQSIVQLTNETFSE